jgi:hypothetical protein
MKSAYATDMSTTSFALLAAAARVGGQTTEGCREGGGGVGTLKTLVNTRIEAETPMKAEASGRGERYHNVTKYRGSRTRLTAGNFET